MKTLVFQSYRSTDVADWIRHCMASVRNWAAAKGYEYRFLGDELFDPCPGWFRQKSGASLLPMTDLCRLLWALHFIQRSRWERIVWVDADMLVFQPDAFDAPGDQSFSLVREIWAKPLDGGVEIVRKVNNSVLSFKPGNVFLSFYIDACYRIAREAIGPLHHLQVGTTFLTDLNAAYPLPLMKTVGSLSPKLLQALASGDRLWPSAHRAACGGPVHAANLCRSLNADTETTNARVIEALLRTRGAALNNPV